MNKLSTVCLVFAWILSPPLRADLTIIGEGACQGTASTFTLHLSGGNVQVQGEKASLILIPKENRLIIVLPQQMAYLEKTIDLSGRGGVGSAISTLPEPPIVTHTGKKERINGFDCEQVIAKTSGGITTEFWFSPQGPSISDVLTTLQIVESQNIGGVNLSWVQFMASNRELKTFPIRAISRDSSGAEQIRYTINSVNENPIAPTVFAPPPGFYGLQLPGL